MGKMKMKLHAHLLVLLVVFINLSSCREVPAVFIFGDSVFEAGNNRLNKNCSVQADFPPYGSAFSHHVPTGGFTNGRTVADFISQSSASGCNNRFGGSDGVDGSRKAYPSNGINFAIAGAVFSREPIKTWFVTIFFILI
ncbi:hypothetical protein F3Y22_tig00112863pilonHSYRG00026 [Hibiscus syriacus]|uniref:GDSL esterase/lipase n=1 Tax=Hibiscus syriacus TaxID=106335 RepID=A0A6A2X4Z7_HIBSY|nr:hypothetical protein F3Y22_tig00112863pilonHSYRG00026 [Hibiscus syriacus]